jgi:hypothetical protein
MSSLRRVYFLGIIPSDAKALLVRLSDSAVGVAGTGVALGGCVGAGVGVGAGLQETVVSMAIAIPRSVRRTKGCFMLQSPCHAD